MISPFCTFPSVPPFKARSKRAKKKKQIPGKTDHNLWRQKKMKSAHLQQVITEDFCFLCSVKQKTYH